MFFENGKHHEVLSGDLDSANPVSGDVLYNNHGAVPKNGSAVGTASLTSNGDENKLEQNQETARPVNMEGSQGMPSPSPRATESDGGSLERTQTFGQKIMGNMRDNLFVRSFTQRTLHLMQRWRLLPPSFLMLIMKPTPIERLEPLGNVRG